MTRRLIGPVARSWWVLPLAAMLAHAALAVVAVAEVAAWGWPLATWVDTVAVTLVLTSAAAGLAATARVAVQARAGSRAIRAWIRVGRRPPPRAVLDEAVVLGCAAKLDVVAGTESFAFTYGLFRPRILVSTGLATTLTSAEIGAVLAHEREHLLRRHPLRQLGARLLAAWGCYLPAARWLADRAAVRRELAADLAAVRHRGRSVLAGALLKLASTPACPAVAAARPTGGGPWSLQARVTQLEGGRPPRQRPGASRMLASASTLSLLGPAFLCCAALSQFLPGSPL